MGSMEILMVVLLLLIYLGLIGVCIAQYILQSLSMYTIADKRGVKNAWLAWIPIGDAWVLGKVVDEYDERCNTKKNWAKTLLTLNLLGGVFFAVTYVAFFVFVFATIISEGDLDSWAIVPFIVLYLLLLVAVLMLSAGSVLKMICTYKVYESIVPHKAIKYMIVSVLVPLGAGICMHKTKKALCAQIEAIQLEYYNRMRQEQMQQQATQPQQTWQPQQATQPQQSSLAQTNNQQLNQ